MWNKMLISSSSLNTSHNTFPLIMEMRYVWFSTCTALKHLSLSTLTFRKLWRKWYYPYSFSTIVTRDHMDKINVFHIPQHRQLHLIQLSRHPLLSVNKNGNFWFIPSYVKGPKHVKWMMFQKDFSVLWMLKESRGRVLMSLLHKYINIL